MSMKKIIFVMTIVFLLNLTLASAISQQEINEAKSLIETKADCKDLSDSQLEIIGEYYMEQMHPGEAHELMHKMMGLEEGSEAEKQVHINMARRLYCNENFGGIGSGGMGGMMRYGHGYQTSWDIFSLLLWTSVIVLIIWLAYKYTTEKKSENDTPMEILKKRFANGEITREEFEKMKKVIKE